MDECGIVQLPLPNVTRRLFFMSILTNSSTGGAALLYNSSNSVSILERGAGLPLSLWPVLTFGEGATAWLLLGYNR